MAVPVGSAWSQYLISSFYEEYNISGHDDVTQCVRVKSKFIRGVTLAMDRMNTY